MIKKKSSSIFGELLGLAISLAVVIYLIPQLPFITKNYSLWLPVAIYTTIISSVFDVAKYIAHKKLYFIFKALALLPDIFSTVKLIQIFPLDFSLVHLAWLNSAFHTLLYLCIFGTSIAFIVNIVKSCTYSEEAKK